MRVKRRAAEESERPEDVDGDDRERSPVERSEPVSVRGNCRNPEIASP
jgi:hypothetical protein